MKKYLIILLLLCVSLLDAQSNISNANTTNRYNYLMVKHDYVISYNDSLHHANWVGWKVDKTHIGNTDRQNDFAEDKTLPKGFTLVTPSDYSNSGYDKGHLCNSQAWTDNVVDNQETFLMTNMIPQSPKCNRGTWKSLEDYCQVMALTGKKLTIYAGGYLTKGYISKKKISIPAFCWKVIFITGFIKPICVVMPNDENIDADWKKYQKDLQYVESITHYKF